MNAGKLVRLNRLFSHPSGRMFSVAVDHFIGCPAGMPHGLRSMKATLASIVAARPDAITMYGGVASVLWKPFAGQVPIIVQSTLDRSDDTVYEQVYMPADAVRLGAEAIAVVAYVRGSSEGRNLRLVASMVREAAVLELPVICHIYPRDPRDLSRISHEPQDVAWAVRCAAEVGVDVIKAPYCGDVTAQAQIVADCPVPLVAAGGPKHDMLEGALGMMTEVVESGARGATVGRNVWGFPQITAAVLAFKAVIHDGKSPEQAVRIAGL